MSVACILHTGLCPLDFEEAFEAKNSDAAIVCLLQDTQNEGHPSQLSLFIVQT